MSNIPNSSYGNQEIDIQIDIRVIAQELANDPDFIAAIAKAVRDQQTKDARKMGNLYSKWAQTTPPAPTTRNRIN